MFINTFLHTYDSKFYKIQKNKQTNKQQHLIIFPLFL